MNALVASARDWLNAGLGFLFPEVCQICHLARATPSESFLCAACRAKVRFLEPPLCQRCGRPFPGAITTLFECNECRQTEPPFDLARAVVAFTDPVKEVIHRYKYNRALWFEPFLAGLLVERAGPALRAGDWTCLVPVPLHPTKQREREFNQAEQLAARLGAATGIPLQMRLLQRVVATRTQTQLSREERRENVRRAFQLREPQRLEGQRMVLIDDVFTTGATTGACARVLRQAGAAEVCVWTVARGI